MTDNRKISLCFTCMNNVELLLESFKAVINDDRVSEIVIVDDHSEPQNYELIASTVTRFKKVRLYRNDKNLGCYANKRRAIEIAYNDYVVIFDSDNILRREYIDAIFSQQWRPDTILQPEFAEPAFNFTPWTGMTITHENVANLFETSNAKKGQFDCLLNVMNYFVHRDSYLEVWQEREDPWAADSIFQNYNWFKSGRKMFVVPGMRYFHRLHTGSHFLAHEKKSRELHKELADQIKELI